MKKGWKIAILGRHNVLVISIFLVQSTNKAYQIPEIAC
jgi:hypothetical protein